jgi:hypothetical protein
MNRLARRLSRPVLLALVIVLASAPALAAAPRARTGAADRVARATPAQISVAQLLGWLLWPECGGSINPLGIPCAKSGGSISPLGQPFEKSGASINPLGNSGSSEPPPSPPPAPQGSSVLTATNSPGQPSSPR